MTIEYFKSNRMYGRQIRIFDILNNEFIPKKKPAFKIKNKKIVNNDIDGKSLMIVLEKIMAVGKNRYRIEYLGSNE